MYCRQTAAAIRNHLGAIGMNRNLAIALAFSTAAHAAFIGLSPSNNGTPLPAAGLDKPDRPAGPEKWDRLADTSQHNEPFREVFEKMSVPEIARRAANAHAAEQARADRSLSPGDRQLLERGVEKMIDAFENKGAACATLVSVYSPVVGDAAKASYAVMRMQFDGASRSVQISNLTKNMLDRDYVYHEISGYELPQAIAGARERLMLNRWRYSLGFQASHDPDVCDEVMGFTSPNSSRKTKILELKT
jgi:hypothetical protein